MNKLRVETFSTFNYIIIYYTRADDLIQIKSSIQDQENNLNNYRVAFGKTWGLSHRVLLWIYTALVHPYFSSAAVVWWSLD